MNITLDGTVAWFGKWVNKRGMVLGINTASSTPLKARVEGKLNSESEENFVLEARTVPIPGRKPIILLPVDFSAGTVAAYETSLTLARKTGGRLVLIHALHLNILPHGPANPCWFYDDLVREGMEKAEPFLRRAQAAGVQGICSVEAGVQSEVILRAARKWRADIIVLSTGRRQWLSRLFARRTVVEVLNAAQCPVMVLDLKAGGQGYDQVKTQNRN